jgi:O-antigen/teichoic acid export membrane protein
MTRMCAQQSADGLSTEHLQADLRGRSVRGGALNVVSQGAQFLIRTASTVVLARLLTPADFGLVAMVVAITSLATAFADLGLSEATIQRKEITPDQVSALFWINVAIGMGLTLITMASAPLLASFYKEPRLRNITLFLSLAFVIGGLRVQPDALLKRQMRYKAIAIRDIAAFALGVPVAIVIAWRGGGYWALVAFPLTSSFIQMALSWLMVNWRPSLPRRNTQIGSMVAFGGNVAASYLVFNIHRSADNVLIGWYWGATPLGFYSKAYELLMLPVRQLNLPIGSVAVSAFSRIQGEPERFARYYLRTAGLIMWISTPIFGFLLVAAQPVIVLILGAQWRAAAPVFQILAISAVGQMLLESTVWLFVSLGQSARLLKMLLLISPVIIGSFVVGLPFGIKGVALAYSVALTLTLPWILHFAFRGTSLTLRQLGRAILCPISVCLLGIASSELFLQWIAPVHVLSQLLVVAIGFAVAYSLAVLIRPIREEALSFRSVLRELRPPREAPVPVT